MLLGFKVKNFRSFKEAVNLDLQATSSKELRNEATFETGNYALLKTIAVYGPNASGKSNLLKAMAVFKTMVLESLLRNNPSVNLPNEFFKLNISTIEKPTGFEVTLLIDNTTYRYGFDFNKTRIMSEYLKKGNITLFNRTGKEFVIGRTFKDATKGLVEQTDDKVLFLTVLNSYNRELSKKIVESINKIHVVIDTGSTLDYTFTQFINNKELSEKIRKFNLDINPGVYGIEANEVMTTAEKLQIPSKFRAAFFNENSPIAQRSMKFLRKMYDSKNIEVGSQAMDFMTEESFGTQNSFALSSPIVETLETGGTLFVDELNVSLHPVLCQYLITIFNSKLRNPNNAQLIFTTHDTTLLDEKLLRRDQIYFTDKNKYGSTDLFSLADISERKGVSFAKRYLEGRYNAIPYFKGFETLRFDRED